MKTVAILYGWSEGPWHSRAFTKLLEEKDLSITRDIHSADVIVAHSLGCYMLPQNLKARVVILIGLPYWPGRSIFKSLGMNLALEAKQGRGIFWWLNRSLHAWFYIVMRSLYTLQGLRRRRKLDFELPPKNAKVILVRNKHDAFCHPQLRSLIPRLKGYRLVEMPGGHEDWWINPKAYTELLFKEL